MFNMKQQEQDFQIPFELGSGNSNRVSAVSNLIQRAERFSEFEKKNLWYLIGVFYGDGCLWKGLRLKKGSTKPFYQYHTYLTSKDKEFVEKYIESFRIVTKNE